MLIYNHSIIALKRKKNSPHCSCFSYWKMTYRSKEAKSFFSAGCLIEGITRFPGFPRPSPECQALVGSATAYCSPSLKNLHPFQPWPNPFFSRKRTEVTAEVAGTKLRNHKNIALLKEDIHLSIRHRCLFK